MLKTKKDFGICSTFELLLSTIVNKLIHCVFFFINWQTMNVWVKCYNITIRIWYFLIELIAVWLLSCFVLKSKYSMFLSFSWIHLHQICTNRFILLIAMGHFSTSKRRDVNTWGLFDWLIYGYDCIHIMISRPLRVHKVVGHHAEFSAFAMKIPLL